MRTRIYIDGFNLYYGALKGHRGRKWLNLEAFGDGIAARSDVVDRVVYCTARVKPMPTSPQAHVHQDAYLRALKTLERVMVVEGRFQQNRSTTYTLDNPPRRVRYLKIEEKGSDVNLAAHLLLDGFRGAYDKAIVVTNDSDLATPIRMAVRELSRRVVVINPRGGRSTRSLVAVASACHSLRAGPITRNQLPASVTGVGGRTITKPADW